MLVEKLEEMLNLNWTDQEKVKLKDLISSVKKYKWFIPKSLESLIVECLNICHNTLSNLYTRVSDLESTNISTE